MTNRDFTLARCEKHQSDYAIDAATNQGMCPDCRRELPPDTAPEYGWVIEYRESELYFDGTEWTSNHLQAMRFAREQDAMVAIDSIAAGIGNAVQRMWLGDAIHKIPTAGAPKV